ncbi:MAG: hypothetical protein AAB585_02370 [Patescibacteria group bacterium]
MGNEPKLISSGPVFESGPGWGAKTGRWLGKYFWPIVVPLVVAAGLYLGSRI